MTSEKLPHEIRSIEETSEELVIIVDQMSRRTIIGITIVLCGTVAAICIPVAIVQVPGMVTILLAVVLVMGGMFTVFLLCLIYVHNHPFTIILDSHMSLTVNGKDRLHQLRPDFTGTMGIGAGEHFSTETRTEMEGEGVETAHYLTIHGRTLSTSLGERSLTIFRGKQSLVRYLADRLNSWLPERNK